MREINTPNLRPFALRSLAWVHPTGPSGGRSRPRNPPQTVLPEVLPKVLLWSGLVPCLSPLTRHERLARGSLQSWPGLVGNLRPLLGTPWLRCAPARRYPHPQPEPEALPQPSKATRALSEGLTLGASAALNPKSGGVWVVRGGYIASRPRAAWGVKAPHSTLWRGAHTQRAHSLGTP